MSQETGKQGALKAAQLWINQHFNDPAPIMLAALIEFTEYQLAEAQAARERAFEASNADLEKRRVAERQLARALETIQRLQNWVNDLQAGMYINCVYCGHHYGPKDEVPATMAEVLKQHIEQCPEHPCSKLKARVEALEAENGRLRDLITRGPAQYESVEDSNYPPIETYQDDDGESVKDVRRCSNCGASNYTYKPSTGVHTNTCRWSWWLKRLRAALPPAPRPWKCPTFGGSPISVGESAPSTTDGKEEDGESDRQDPEPEA